MGVGVEGLTRVTGSGTGLGVGVAVSGLSGRGRRRACGVGVGVGAGELVGVGLGSVVAVGLGGSVAVAGGVTVAVTVPGVRSAARTAIGPATPDAVSNAVTISRPTGLPLPLIEPPGSFPGG